MKRWFSLFMFVAAISGCVNMPQKADTGQQPETERSSQADDSVSNIPYIEDGEKDNKPTRPNVPLSEDILYKLLLAEIAGQRGKLDVSVKNYLDLARQTLDPAIIERATRIAVYARDDKATGEAASLWLEVEPDNADANQVLAIIAIRNGQTEKAIKHLQNILDHDENKLDQKLWMIANMLGREKDQKTVMLVIKHLIAGHENDSDALFAFAQVVSQLGDLDKANSLMERVIQLKPDNENAVISYVSLLQRQKKITEALVWLEKYLKGKQGDNFKLRVIYARLLADAGRYEESKQQFKELNAEQADNIEVLYALGLLHLESNHIDEAEKYFLQLSQRDEQAKIANYYLGRIAQEKEQWEEAKTWYKSVPDGEHYFDSQIRIAMLWAKQGKIKQAQQHLHHIKAKNTQQESMLIQVEAEMLVGEKRHDEAMAIYDQVLQSHYDADILYSRAMLAEKIGRLDILEEDLKQILEHDPENAQALNALGYTLADRTERYDEAYQYIKKAIELRPNDFYILDSMGWVLYRLGRLQEAVDYLRKALALNPDPEIAAHLGEVLWVMGDKEGAKNVWDTALKATPEDSKLLNVIKRFSH